MNNNNTMPPDPNVLEIESTELVGAQVTHPLLAIHPRYLHVHTRSPAPSLLTLRACVAQVGDGGPPILLLQGVAQQVHCLRNKKGEIVEVRVQVKCDHRTETCQVEFVQCLVNRASAVPCPMLRILCACSICVL
jgi:hypothetical protein